MIGDKICENVHCGAMLLPGESSSLCCNNKRVVSLQPVQDPPEPLKSLIVEDKRSEFKKNITRYNDEFKMSNLDFEAPPRMAGFDPLIRVQGQIVANARCHLIPEDNALQDKTRQRDLNPEIVMALNDMLKMENALVKTCLLYTSDAADE